MHSLAIVDDEPAIRNGLTRHVDWRSLGFEVVASLEDGEDALSYLADHHLDVVLTDIRMSVVSGLSLAQTIYEQEIPTEVVLLTGYKDFEYARSAMRSGVRHYLLKPTQQEEIRAVFQELAQEISEKRHGAKDGALRRLVAESRRRLLLRLVEGLVPDSATLTAEWRASGLPPLRVGTSISYAAVQVTENGAMELRHDVRRLSVEEPAVTTVPLYEPPDLLHFLMVTENESDENDGVAAAQFCRTLAARNLKAGSKALGRTLHSFEVREIERLLHLGDDPWESEDELSHLEDSSPDRRSTSHVDPDAVEELLDESPDRRSRASVALTKTLCFRTGDSVVARSLPSVRRNCVEFVGVLLAACRRRKPELRLAPPPDYDELFRSETREDAAAWLNQTVAHILSVLEDNGSAQPHSRAATAEQARTYIAAHLSEDIGLDRVAQELFLSPAYLSRLFREQTGETFMDCVTTLRIERAIALLKNRSIRSIAEVARSVGYRDPKYFTRVFKDRLGRTPSQYRRAMVGRHVS